MNKVQLVRLVFIDRRIREGMRQGRLANCSSMARDYEVSSKTILRDIDYLRNQRQAPIEYDPVRKGYYYSEENYSLPAISLTESDLFAICIARQGLERYRNTPIHERLLSVFDKIGDALPERVSIRPEWLDSRVSLLEEPRTSIDPQIWEGVATGLRDNRQIEIDYGKPGQAENMVRQVAPYHVLHYQGEWYLIGYCRLRQTVRTFAVSRIRRVELLGERFTLPADFDLETFWGQRFGVFGGEGSYRVCIWFSAQHAPYIRERQWQAGQQISEAGDGGIYLTRTASHLYELQRWVLSGGGGVRVEEPEELAQAVQAELETALAGYR